MSFSLANTPVFSLIKNDQNQLTLQSAEGHLAHIFILEEDIIRLMILPAGKLNLSKTWAIAVGQSDIPREGRDRFDLTGFALPSFSCKEDEKTLIIHTQKLRLTIQKIGLFTTYEQQVNGAWILMMQDRLTQSVNFDWWDEKVYHYLARDQKDELYFGLGERAGETNRHGQSYRFCNVDPMGYNARTSDPLYKHIPFYMTWKKASQSAFGIFYDTLSDCTFNFGKELDNYHGHYRYFVADYGDLDFYVIAGHKPKNVTERFTWMTGKPAFTPKWGIGYSGSTMTYTDAPNAQERMNEFLAKCAEHDIPCDSFHLSSGYTTIKDKRYVFNWNRDKFPDPAAFAAHYLDHGVRLCANIKPCLLKDHPRFDAAKKAQLFIHEKDGSPAQVQFWDETGAYLDFTNPETFDWWKLRITEALLEYGIASTWNDNNEFEIWSKTPQIHGFGNSFGNSFGQSQRAIETRTLHTLLMIKASYEAQSAFSPNKRPFLISRAGAAGMQRYVQTWSGDNYTSWETLRYNIKMGLGLAISGVSNTGHDIGGFSGPMPDAELFVRWVGNGIFHPRFSIHSWNEDKTVNEPWMHPEITPHVRKLIKLRYRLIPYIYDLLWRSHSQFEPMIRPTFYDFPEDAQTFIENDDMLLGEKLLVASVVEPNKREREVYLPKSANWFDYFSGQFFTGGQTITLAAPVDAPPLLVRANSILPLNIAETHFAKNADERAFSLFIEQEADFADAIFEDDGESTDALKGDFGQWQFHVTADTKALQIEVKRAGNKAPKATQTTLIFPRQETRKIQIVGAKMMSDQLNAVCREVFLHF